MLAPAVGVRRVPNIACMVFDGGDGLVGGLDALLDLWGSVCVQPLGGWWYPRRACWSPRPQECPVKIGHSLENDKAVLIA